MAVIVRVSPFLVW